MVILVLAIVVLCAALGVCFGAWLYAHNEAHYWKEVCARLITPQKKEEKVTVVNLEDGEPQW